MRSHSSAARSGVATPRRSTAASSGSRSRARISGSVTVPSSRSVPAVLPVRSAGPETSSTSSRSWKARPIRRPNAPSASASPRRPAAERARAGRPPRTGARSSARSVEVALERHLGVPRVLALQQLALGERGATRRTARAPPPARPVAASSANARENSRSPVAVAMSRPARGHDGRAPPPQRGGVEHVVVDERGASGRAQRPPPPDHLDGARRGPAASSTRSGRRRLPPAAIVAPAWLASTGPWPAASAARRSSTAASSGGMCAPPAWTTASRSARPPSADRLGNRSDVEGDDAARRQDPAHVAQAAAVHLRGRARAGPGSASPSWAGSCTPRGRRPRAHSRDRPGRTTARRTMTGAHARRRDLQDDDPPAGAHDPHHLAHPATRGRRSCARRTRRWRRRSSRRHRAARARCPTRSARGPDPPWPARDEHLLADTDPTASPSGPTRRASSTRGRPCPSPRRARDRPDRPPTRSAARRRHAGAGPPS